MNRETVGKISSDLLEKAKDNTHSSHEQMQEQLSEHDKFIHECLATHKKVWPSTNFYIVVITKKEPTMPYVIRSYFLGRLSCPTPDYDQVVYMYHHESDFLEVLWVIPSKHTCLFFLRDSFQIAAEEKDLLNYVLDFADGSLFRKAQFMNGELPD